MPAWDFCLRARADGGSTRGCRVSRFLRAGMKNLPGQEATGFLLHQHFWGSSGGLLCTCPRLLLILTAALLSQDYYDPHFLDEETGLEGEVPSRGRTARAAEPGSELPSERARPGFRPWLASGPRSSW